MTNQGKRQASFRAIAGSSSTYNGDALAAFAADGVTETEFNGAFVAWLQQVIPSTGTNLNGLKAEYAALYGVTSWNELGHFIPSVDLEMWFDAADTDTITVATGASQWDNKSGDSGRDATQGTGGLQPATGTRTINGLNALDFDGVDDLMSIAGVRSIFSISANFTFFIVIQSDVAAPPTQMTFSSTDGNEDRFMQMLNTSEIRTGTNDGANKGKSTAFTDITSPHVVSFTNTSSNVINQFLDGTLSTGTNAPFGSSSFATTIGARTSGDLNFNGLIAEIIVYSRIISTAERELVETYLTEKWGI